MKIRLCIILLMGGLAHFANAKSPDKRAYFFIRSDVQKLTAKVTAKAETDSQRVESICNWITHNIKYDIKKYFGTNAPLQSAEVALKKRKTLCLGYSLLFRDMCEAAGIPSITVTGYSKNLYVDLGDTLYLPDHAWNMVQVNSEWINVDNTWDAGYISNTKTSVIRTALHFLSLGLVKPYRHKVHFVQHPTRQNRFEPHTEFVVDHLASNPRLRCFTAGYTAAQFETDSADYFMDSATHHQVVEFTPSYLATYYNLTDSAQRMEDAEFGQDGNPNNTGGWSYFYYMHLKKLWKELETNSDLKKDTTFLNELISYSDSCTKYAAWTDSLLIKQYGEMREKHLSQRQRQRTYNSTYISYLKRKNRTTNRSKAKAKSKLKFQNSLDLEVTARQHRLQQKIFFASFSMVSKISASATIKTERKLELSAARCDSLKAAWDSLALQKDTAAWVWASAIMDQIEYNYRIYAFFDYLFWFRSFGLDDDDLYVHKVKGFLPNPDLQDSLIDVRGKEKRYYALAKEMHRTSLRYLKEVRKQIAYLDKLSKVCSDFNLIALRKDEISDRAKLYVSTFRDCSKKTRDQIWYATKIGAKMRTRNRQLNNVKMERYVHKGTDAYKQVRRWNQELNSDRMRYAHRIKIKANLYKSNYLDELEGDTLTVQ